MIILIILTEHECSYPGCQLAIVIDGNQKNRRSVCMASQAGYVEYPSLPAGSIVTGCTNSPAFKSRFCSVHCPRSCSTPKYLCENDLDGSGVSVDQPTTNSDEQVVGVIRDKKTTRNSVYYKVISACLCKYSLWMVNIINGNSILIYTYM